MATFIGTAGVDNFQGTAAADDFYFDSADISFPDVIYGGGTLATDGKDRLILSGTAPINLGYLVAYDYTPPYDPPFYTLLGFEDVLLSSSGSTITLTHNFANSSQNGRLEVHGTGNGADKIYLGTGFYEEIRTSSFLVYGGGGDDLIADSFSGSPAGDQLYGDAGNDTIIGTGKLDGGTGDDTITAIGRSQVTGGDGNDSFFNYGEGSTIDGGAGLDKITLDYLPNNVTYLNLETAVISNPNGTIQQLSQLTQFSRIEAVDPAIGARIILTGGGNFDLSSLPPGLNRLIISAENNSYVYDLVGYSLVGISGENVFLGSKLADYFYGGSSADQLYGNAGDDYLYGGGGNDLLLGAAGSDHVFGGVGDDTFSLDGWGDLVFYQGGYYPRIANDFLYGGEGNDTFVLERTMIGVRDPISGLFSGGTAAIDGGEGIDRIDTESDLSALTITSVEVVVSLGTLTASAAQLAAFQYIYLGDGSVRVTGSGVVDLNGRLGNTTVDLSISTSGIGDRTVYGSAGNDKFWTFVGNDTFYGGDGNDTFDFYSQYYVANGGSGTAHTYGGNGNDTFNNSYDFLSPRLNDSMFGGAGDDIFYAKGGTIDGGTGFDTLVINGPAFFSNITSIEKLVVVYNVWPLPVLTASMAQLNQIQIFETVDNHLNLILTGTDQFDLSTRLGTNSVSASFSGQTSGVGFVGTLLGDSVTGTDFSDNLASGAGADVVLGNDGNDLIYGGADGDSLQGQAGNDTIYGGDGGDAIYGGLGNDFMSGDNGNDSLISIEANGYVLGNLGNDTILGGAGDDYIWVASFMPSYNVFSYSTYYIDGGEGADYIASESVRGTVLGGAGSDTIVSYGDSNYIDGGAGNDNITAKGLHDYALGGAGDDLLTCNGDAAVYLLGQDGSDIVTGGDGNDYLNGGTGVDFLFGGYGTDYFVGGAQTDYFIMNYDVAANEYDFISDFTAGIDYIGLSAALKGAVSFTDTAYGVDIICNTGSGKYQLFILGVHDIVQVKAAVYYDGV